MGSSSDAPTADDGAFLQALLRDTTLAVAVTDVTGSISLMSPALEALLHMPFEAVAPEQMAEHFNVRTEDGTRLLRAEEIPINRARAGESFRDARIAVLREDGVLLHLRCSGTPVRQRDGSISGGLILVTDVTAEQAVVMEQKALRDRLVETVNHELRTPLTKLLGHAELLEDLDPDLPASIRFSLDALITAGHELKDIVQTVSELVDLDAAGRLDTQVVDVPAQVREVVHDLDALARERDVAVRTDLAEGSRAQIDPRRYRKAVTALVENALTYAPAGSQVSLCLAVDEVEVHLDVLDTGPGIPERDRSRLMQPFERGDQPGQPVNSRGLGLAVAHTVALAHGGTLVLRDNHPCGLRASLVVPVTAQPVVA